MHFFLQANVMSFSLKNLNLLRIIYRSLFGHKTDSNNFLHLQNDNQFAGKEKQNSNMIH